MTSSNSRGEEAPKPTNTFTVPEDYDDEDEDDDDDDDDESVIDDLEGDEECVDCCSGSFEHSNLDTNKEFYAKLREAEQVPSSRKDDVVPDSAEVEIGPGTSVDSPAVTTPSQTDAVVGDHEIRDKPEAISRATFDTQPRYDGFSCGYEAYTSCQDWATPALHDIPMSSPSFNKPVGHSVASHLGSPHRCFLPTPFDERSPGADGSLELPPLRTPRSPRADGPFELPPLRVPRSPSVRYFDGPFMMGDQSGPMAQDDESPKDDACTNKSDVPSKDESGDSNISHEAGNKEMNRPARDDKIASSSSSESHKRKASEMETTGEERAEELGELYNITKKERIGAEAAGLKESFRELNDILSELERPKRAKTTHVSGGSKGKGRASRDKGNKGKRVRGSGGKGIVSHAATAVVSALIGGIGTVALLASLPTEIFH